MNKFSSVFGQILQIFSKAEFYKAVKELKAEKGAKGFSCWEQFVAMLFCQLGQAHSLREICGGLATCLGKLRHLGVESAPKRSTLSYANEHRPWELYQKVFYQLLGKCQGLAKGKKKFRFKGVSCKSLFVWFDRLTTNGKKSMVSTKPPFALSLSKGDLELFTKSS